MKAFALLLAATFGLAIATPVEARSCAGLFVRTTQATRIADATLIRTQARQRISARYVGKVIDDGRWRLVWATPAEAERGVYFFRHTGKSGLRYADVWGGVIAPGEERDATRWARGLRGGGPDTRTVACFIDRVKAGY